MYHWLLLNNLKRVWLEKVVGFKFSSVSDQISNSHLHLVDGGTYLPKLRVHLAHGDDGGVGVARAVGKCCCGSRTDSAVMRPLWVTRGLKCGQIEWLRQIFIFQNSSRLWCSFLWFFVGNNFTFLLVWLIAKVTWLEVELSNLKTLQAYLSDLLPGNWF